MKIFIKWSLFIFLFFPTVILSCTDRQTEVPDLDLPNVLWITCEDLSPMLGTYGDQVAVTPSLDRLAENGIQYNNAFATSPVCSPARSCLVTGLYATTLGTHDHRSDFNLPEKIKTLPHILREYGYYCTNNRKRDYNFSDTTIWNESSGTAHWRNRPDGAPFFSVFNFETTHQSRIFGDDETFHNRFGKLLTESQRHDPSNIKLPPYIPDSPEIRKLWARYYDLTTLMDRQTGELLEQLEDDGLRESTIVFFFSDHGTGMPRSKGVLYNSGTRVPLIVYLPEKFRYLTEHEPGTQTGETVSFVDLQPTVLSLIGWQIPSYWQGRPFLGSQKMKPRRYAFAARDRIDEVFDISRSVKTDSFNYIRNYLPHLPWMQPNYYNDQSEIMQELYRLKEDSVFTQAEKHIWQSHRPPEELYDLRVDPYELNNLVNDPQYYEVLVNLRGKLKDWILETRDAGFMPEGYVIKNTKSRIPFDLARDSSLYPLKEILELNELLLRKPIDQEILASKLTHSHELIRYWAAVNLQSVKEPSPRTLEELRSTLADKSLYVQLAAADALCAHDQCDEQAQKVILNGLRSQRMIDVLTAARVYQWHHKKARKIEDEVRKIYHHLDSITTEEQWKGYDINALWALKAAFGITE